MGAINVILMGVYVVVNDPKFWDGLVCANCADPD